jgi:hypothetical protein
VTLRAITPAASTWQLLTSRLTKRSVTRRGYDRAMSRGRWPHGFAARTVITLPSGLIMTGERTGGLRGGGGNSEPMVYAVTASIRTPATRKIQAGRMRITALPIRVHMTILLSDQLLDNLGGSWCTATDARGPSSHLRELIKSGPEHALTRILSLVRLPSTGCGQASYGKPSHWPSQLAEAPGLLWQSMVAGVARDA